jgi:DNA topoisomerase-1
MEGLTAKVFRTYNASWTMSQLLQKIPVDKKLSDAQKLALYNECNKQVAVLCNHKRTVGAGHQTQMEKLSDRIKGLKYQKWRTKMMMIDVDPKMKKKKGAEFFELDDDLDESWIQEHQAFLVEEERKKITKKFEKENEKRVADKEKPLPEKELKERLKAANELEAKFKKENKSKKVEAEGKSPPIEKLENSITKLEERIQTLEIQSADREGNKEVALGTSKIVSTFLQLDMHQVIHTDRSRTTSILASALSFARRSILALRRSFRRRSATSSSGPSSRLATIPLGSSRLASEV